MASVLTSMLRTHDMWACFAARYLDALDESARWHLQLLDRLDDPETGPLLDRLVAHPSLEGPELTLLQARLARQRDDVAHARALVGKVLEDLPGHRDALAFAQEIGAPLPSAAARIAAEQPD